jgi:sugar phosphate isomerase/epimerase
VVTGVRGKHARQFAEGTTVVVNGSPEEGERKVGHMKASVSAWSYRWFFDNRKIDLLGFVDEVKAMGADGFEVFPQYVDGADPGGHLKAVADKARSVGLEISSAIAGNDFARPAAQERADQVARMKRWIADSAAAGILRLNTFTGYHRSGQDPVLDVYRVIDAYLEVAPLAEQHGALLCIENHSSVCADADGLLRIIRAVGSPCMRTNPDPSNFVADFNIRGEKTREAIYTETEKIAPLAANAHLKIGDFAPDGEHAFLSVARLHDIYRKVGYDGHVVLEVYRDAEKAPDLCRKGLALLRRHFA